MELVMDIMGKQLLTVNDITHMENLWHIDGCHSELDYELRINEMVDL
jgi:hypothetical protein